MALPRSVNTTNLRLGVLTFILSLVVLWSFSLSTASDPSLNFQNPGHSEPLPKPSVSSEFPTPTSADLDATWPSPGDQDQNQESEPLPPPPEIVTPPPAPAPPSAPEDLPTDLLPPDLQNTPQPDDTLLVPISHEQHAPPDQTPPVPVPIGDPNLLNPVSDPDPDLDLIPNPDFPHPNSPPQIPQSDRPLIVYAYSESATARSNLEFFVAKGLHGAADFIFIINGNASATMLIPQLPNVKIVTRPNTCYDLGAIGEVLRKDDLWKKYTRFITMNASIRGPFVPMWSRDCWSELYLRKVTETTKLVGMTVNCKPRPHVQSMILATDAVGMAVLLDPEQGLEASVKDQFGAEDSPVGLSGCYTDYKTAVHAEVGTTGLIKKAGYEVDAMMTALHTEQGPDEYCTANPKAGDVLFDGTYFGANVHPYETIFIKANRNVDPVLLEDMTGWHMKMATSSFDTCGVL